MPDPSPSDPTSVPVPPKSRKTIYLVLAAGMLIATIALIIMGFGSLNDYYRFQENTRQVEARERTLRPDGRSYNNMRIIPKDAPLIPPPPPDTRSQAQKEQDFARELEGARLMESGSYSVALGTFAAAAGCLLMTMGFLVAAFQKPKPPPKRRARQQPF